MYVRTPVRPQKIFDCNEIWHVGSGDARRYAVCGMQYDPIQGQGQGHEPLKVGNLSFSFFKRYLLRHLHWDLATNHLFLN